MATNAKVHSFEAIRYLHAALIVFAEEATGVLSTLHQEMIRTMEWLSHDQPAHWKRMVQKGFEEVAQARVALARAKMKGMDGNPPSCIEEKKALQKAKQSLAHAQKQIEVVRHWGVKMQQESDEFRGRLGNMETMVSLEIPRMLMLLENMVTALEKYVAVQTVESDRALAEELNSRRRRNDQKQSAGNSQAQPAAPGNPADPQGDPIQPQATSAESEDAVQANQTGQENQS